MKKPLFFYLLISSLILITFSNCKEEEPPPPMARTIQEVFDDFQAIDISPGVHDETLEFLFNRSWDFRIVAPEVVGAQTYPLIFDLHGASGGNPDAHKHTDCYVEEGFEDLDVFIISPNGGAKLWHEFENQEMVINLLNYAKLFWPVDPDKIVVTGYSNGGNGSWYFGESQGASVFSAAIPMASSYSTKNVDGSVRVMPVPMYVIHGENDELFPLEETEGWVSATIDAGSDITFVVADSLGHYTPCDYVPYLKDAAAWLVDEVWK